jgi:hypothetical protein
MSKKTKAALAAAQYERHSAALVTAMAIYITHHFGKRCADTEPGCPICDMWAKHDNLKAYICD